MPRLSRRFTAALLWLAIALLPMRGWAAAWMPVAMAEGGGAAMVVAQDMTPPCHGAEHDGSDGPAAQTCSMCDLCHTQVAQAPDAPALPDAPHEAQPVATTPTPIAPPEADGLFRPPRTDLA